MMWMALIGAVISLGGIWFVSKSMQVRAVVACSVLLAVAAYLVVGRPEMKDAPLEARVEKLQEIFETEPSILGGDEIMAVAMKIARDRPEDPGPRMAMGEMFKAAGRMNEALLEYQAALRRSPDFQPALKAAADTRFQLSGAVDPKTAALYKRAYELAPEDLRLGYFAALGEWTAGRKEDAVLAWNAIDALVSEGDPRQQMFVAVRQAYAPETLEGYEPPVSPEGDVPN